MAYLAWRGAVVEAGLVGVIAWEAAAGFIDIDRLAVDPAFARAGHGRRLVRSVPRAMRAVVSTGSVNVPAASLYQSEGFVETGRTEIAAGVFTTQFERRLG